MVTSPHWLPDENVAQKNVSKTRTNVKFPSLYLKEAGLVSTPFKLKIYAVSVFAFSIYLEKGGTANSLFQLFYRGNDMTS